MTKELMRTVEHFATLLADELSGEIDLDGLRECLEDVSRLLTDDLTRAAGSSTLRDDFIGETLRLCNGARVLQSSGDRSTLGDLANLLRSASDEDLIRYRNNARSNFATIRRSGRLPVRTAPSRNSKIISEFRNSA